jgi:PAS domain S-box-containing protein
LARIAKGAKEMLEASGCTIYLLEDDRHMLVPIVAIESDYEEEILATPLDVDNSFTGQAIKIGHALVFNDAAANELGHHIPGTPVEHQERIIVAPFMVEGKPLGAMCLNRIGAHFSQVELALAETLATYASSIVRNAQTHDTLQHEVEERKRVECALRTERDKAQGYLDIAGVMLVALNRCGEITLINRMGRTILGYAEGELIGKNWFDTCLPERVRQRARSVFDNLMAGATKTFSSFENPVITKSGEIRRIAWHNTVLTDDAGAFIGTLSSGEDISERILTEREIRRRNREMALLNQVIMASTSTADVNHVLHVTCRELARAFGLPETTAALLNADGTEAIVVAEYLLAGRPSRLGQAHPVAGYPAMAYVLAHRKALTVSDVQRDECVTVMHHLMRERGARALLIIPILVARGRVAGVIELHATTQRAFSEEEISLAQNVAAAAGQALETARLYVALRRNVEKLEGAVAQRTAELQVALERAQDADRVKSEFVSNVTHELRTPLANLKLYLGLLDRGRPENRPAYLETLRRETERLQDLIEALLDISRLDLGETRVHLKPIDLNLRISTLVTDREALMADRGLTLKVALGAELPLALADPRLIEQVLTNLLTNAFNYTPAGGVITLRTDTVEVKGRQWVTARVSDTGPGIAPQEQSRLFERFYRGTAGQASSAPGTGLGLAISKEIMELHGGDITLESQPGQGSTFTIWMSVAPAPSA